MTTEEMEQRIVALTKERDWWRGVAENSSDAGSGCRCEACNARQCYAPQRMDAPGIPGIDGLRCALPHGLPPEDPEEGERWFAPWPTQRIPRELSEIGWHVWRSGKWQKEEA
jgi:hypothetical protein